MGRPFKGNYPITAGKYYSSGAKHYALDYACPLGTAVLSVGDGIVTAINDGVANNKPGYNPGTGAPSNYIVVATKHEGKDAYVYYQHLNKGLLVKVGQKVSDGQHIANSGNTGNSSGPHLHVATGWGHPTAVNRYQYMDDKFLIYPPTLLYVAQEEDVPEYMSVSKSTDFDLKATDDWRQLYFDKEASDEDDQHPDSNHPTILSDACQFIATFNLSASHKAATSVVGASLLLRFAKYNVDTKTWTPFPPMEIPLVGESTHALMNMNGVNRADQRLRIQAKLVGLPVISIVDYDCRLTYWLDK